MCGIAGIVSTNTNFDFSRINAFEVYLQNRGPDDTGSFQLNNCAFLHKRLSILDLSPNGKQPFFNETKTVMGVCNGEVYNYLPLRDFLIAKKHRFVSNSDSEVVVHLYEEYGEKFIEHIEGEYAIAIWDDKKGELFLYMDRWGVKPLYFSQTADTFCFSSDFTSLVREFLVRKNLDIDALNQYIVFRYVPAPNTLFEDIKKVPGGHYVKIKDNVAELIKYFSLEYNITPTFEANAVDRVREQTVKAIQSRLMSDVPLGVFLSGGIDSAIVVAAMHQLGINNIKTYAIGFKNEQDDIANEFEYSSSVAKHFKTDHAEIVMTENDFYESLDEWIDAMGEPVGAPAAIPLLWLSKIVSRDIKVVLNGQGSDEVFGGYGWYKRMLLSFDDENIPQQFLKHYAGIQEEEKNALLTNGFVRPHVSLDKVTEAFNAYKNSGVSDNLSAVCYLDFQFGLSGVGLKEVDAVTMYHSLEARVPFLTHDLVKLGATIPQHLKINGNTEKYVLKQAFKDILPEKVINRTKLGFPVPVAAWSKKELGKLTREYVLGKKSLQRGLINKNMLKTLIDSENSSDCAQNKTFRFLVLELWLRKFLD
jgi:asparagine synthase (glutamine-hydrolysing)